MKRRLFTILSALSVLLFVAVVGLWVRSYWVTDLAAFLGNYEAADDDRRHARYWAFACERGQWVVASGLDNDDEMTGWPHIGPVYHLRLIPSERVKRDDLVAGLGFGRQRYGWYLFFPAWLVVVVASTLPLTTLWSWRRRRRRRRRLNLGLCAGCGYDLRATPDRCPECGVAPTAPPPPPTGNLR